LAETSLFAGHSKYVSIFGQIDSVVHKLIEFRLHSALALNEILTKIYFWEDALLSTLPTISSQKPLTFSDAVPKIMQPHFGTFSVLSNHYFKLGADINSKIEWTKWKMESMLKADDIAIGVLYRGGDKLSIECNPTERISCGNITLHSEAAYESYLAIAKSRNLKSDKAKPLPNGIIDDVLRKKPIMVLMTVEPGIFQKFQSDAIGRMFNIIEMPSEFAFPQSMEFTDTVDTRLHS
jgi:hypothetical protein